MKRFEISPHGGLLVDRAVKDAKGKDYWLKRAEHMKKLEIREKHLSDMEMIATGAFSPLEGFMTQKDYESVIENMRLYSGLVWTLPITLDISKETSREIQENIVVALTFNKKIVGTMQIEEKFIYDKEKEARLVYRTTNKEHPGVRNLYDQGDVYVGGKITLIDTPKHKFPEYFHTPEQMRALFKEKGWSRIVGFQTRNPIHMAHEYLQKCALETVDGLLIHPIVGWTKKDDIPADVRLKCYKELIKHYFPEERVMLATFPTYMRYAGPREAIFHALIRKNYGCTHIIIGRDHAGVGDYYGTYEAQELFNEFEEVELMIIPMMFENAFYCKNCGAMATKKTCAHNQESHVSLSGTKVREMLRAGEKPPKEIIRPEVSELLIDYIKNGNGNKKT